MTTDQLKGALNPFGEVVPFTITITESARCVGVSAATIRNWIKTGYLKQAGKSKITLDSLERFKFEISGKEKLTQRANKSQKDLHDHKKVVSDILQEIESGKVSCDILGSKYEESLSDSYRNKEGIYYTPRWIIDDLFNVQNININNKLFCDPCCGSGNFIIRALELGFESKNIYAFDVDPVAVELTKKRIYDRTGFNSPNIVTANFFNLSTKQKKKYDFIFTNPPWGKKIAKNDREVIGKHLKAGSSLDTSSLFFFACLQSLNKNGILGLLLPEAFFNISSHETARICSLKHSIIRLIDYGKPFHGLVTRAQAIVLSNRFMDQDGLVDCEVEGNISKRSVASFSGNPKSILNLWCSHEDAEVISYILSIPHITLKNRAKWGLGIVTGNNKKFIESKNRPDLMPVFKGADITQDGLKSPSCFIPADLSLYQQVAPVEIFESKEKLVYKFISSKLCFYCDKHQHYILNSANMMIPQNDFPVSAKVLGELLSCKLMNWLFSKTFNTHKILRGDIECLPIHSQYLDGDKFVYQDFLNKLGVEETNDGFFRIKKK